MKQFPLIFLLFSAVGASVANADPADALQPDPSADAVERALPWLEKEGTWWIEEKECVSCHHSTFFVWAKDLALEAGFAIDGKVLSEQRQWVWEEMLSPQENADGEDAATNNENDSPAAPKLKGASNVEGVSQLLVSASANHLPEKTKAELIDLIRTNRNEKGDWPVGGQLPRQKRPSEETQRISNQWALAALSAIDPPSEDNAEGQSAKTTEWFALNAVLRRDPESLMALVSRQNPDGGWGWIVGEGSDPTATGQALFALARTDTDATHAAVRARGRAYLVSTQDEKGSWDTKSTKDREKSTRVSDFWGTTWAVIGLLETAE